MGEGKLAVLPWKEGEFEPAILMIRHKDKWLSPTLLAFMDTVRAVVCNPAAPRDESETHCGLQIEYLIVP